MKHKSKFLTACCIIAVSSNSNAAILYSSDADFAKASSGGQNITVAGWAGFHGKIETTAVNTVAATTVGAHKVGLLGGDTGGGSPELNNYIYFQKTTSAVSEMDFFGHTVAGDGVAFSDFTPFSFDTYSAGSLTANWKENADALGGGTYHVSVLVGSTWYASTTNSDSTTGTASFDFLSGDWVEIFDDLSAPLALGTVTTDSTTLFTGEDISGFGFYVNNMALPSSGNRTLRIDDIRIIGEVVPEPSAALLCLIALTGSLCIRRRV